MTSAAMPVADRRRSGPVKRRGFSLLTVPLVMALLVFGTSFGVGLMSPMSAQATVDQSTKTELIEVILSVEPSKADATLWALANQSLGEVNRQALTDAAGDSAELATAAKAYTTLTDTINRAKSQRSLFLLNDVPRNLVGAFLAGSLSQSALLKTAGTVTPLSEIQAAESKAPVATVTRDMADAAEIFARIDDFRGAMGKLDDVSRLMVTGQLEGNLSSLDDQALRDLVATGQPTIVEKAQLQLDRRLADNFPDLSIYSNGKLPDEVLCQIPWSTKDRLLCAAMDNFERMNVAYKAEFGTDMPILDGYRPFADQQYVHWNDPNWTAVPGTSNHGWGLGVDFNWDIFKNFDDPEVVWMIENGPRFGWRHPSALGPDTDRPEPWHFEFGTSYSDVDRDDFQGPIPEVIYKAKTS